MRYQRLGITGIAVLIVVGVTLILTNQGCDDCSNQVISATGDDAPAPGESEVIDRTRLRQALVVDAPFDQSAGPAITLSTDAETTSTTTADDDADESSTTTGPTTSTTASTSTTSKTESAPTTKAAVKAATENKTAVTTASSTPTTAAATTDAPTTAAPTTAAPTTAAEADETTTSSGGGDGGSEDGEGSGSADSTTSSTEAPAPPPPVVSGTPANGPTIYVNPNGGNDGNDGSAPDKAKRSLQDVLRHVQPGQQVLLMSGEYRDLASPGQVHYWMQNSGQPNNWIKIGAAPGQTPVIKATNGTGLLIDGNYVEVSGLTVQGSGFNSSNSWGVGIAIADSHHVNVIGNRVSGMPQSGISTNKTSNFQILNNVVYENSFWHDSNGSGINVVHQKNHGQGPIYGGYNDVVMGNRTYRNENKVPSKWQNHQKITDGNGIIIDSNNLEGYTGRTLVANNLSFDNGGRGINVWASSNVDVMFNTTYHNVRTTDVIGGGAEIGFGRGRNIRVTNNVVWARSGKPGIDFSEVDGSSYAGNNVAVTDVAPKGQNDLVVNHNPGLRNPSISEWGADFRPSPGSMLEGRAGSVDSMVARDLLGTGRSGPTEPGAFIVEASQGR